jgi:hypothetical protein
MLPLSLNDAFPREVVDFLLMLDPIGERPVLLLIDTLLMMGSLVASGLITLTIYTEATYPSVAWLLRGLLG